MANDSAKTERSDPLDKQVEAMARAGSEAEPARDPRVEAQLDDLLAGAPEPDQTLGSLDRQLAALTAELLEGDFADNTDTVTESVESANAVTPDASAAPQAEVIASQVKSSPKASESAEADGSTVPEALAVPVVIASAPEPSAAVAAAEAPAAPAADDIDEPQTAPLPVLPPAPTKQDGEMTLEEQMAALGADLLDGDFESVAGDVVGSTREAAPSSAAEAATPEPTAPASPVTAAHVPTTADSPTARSPESRAAEPTQGAVHTAPPAAGATRTPAAPGPESVSATAATPDAIPAPHAATASAGASGSAASTPESPSTSPSPTARAPEPAARAAPKPAGPPLHFRVRRVLARALRIAEPAAKQAAALASKPLEGRPPVIRQSIGWLAIWTGFLAMCAIMASLMSRPPKPPETQAEPHELTTPPEEPTTPPAPRAGENLRGRPIPPP